MGINTVVIVLNDAMGDIEKDAGFGQNLARASHDVYMGQDGTIRSGCHSNAATVVGVEHADVVQVIAVGGNHATVLGNFLNGGNHHREEDQVAILKLLAEKYGYLLVRDDRADLERRRDLSDARDRAAKLAFEMYDFGAVVGEFDGFSYTSPGVEQECVVYLENNEGPSTRVVFHVEFESEDSSVVKNVWVN